MSDFGPALLQPASIYNEFGQYLGQESKVIPFEPLAKIIRYVLYQVTNNMHIKPSYDH